MQDKKTLKLVFIFQPKLSMARCRRNVDNFIEACRKIGVEEVSRNSFFGAGLVIEDDRLGCLTTESVLQGDLCSVEDVVASLDVAAVLRTVERLLHPGSRPPSHAVQTESPSCIQTGPSSTLLIIIFIAASVLLYFLPHEE